jgi:hypothetical protein
MTRPTVWWTFSGAGLASADALVLTGFRAAVASLPGLRRRHFGSGDINGSSSGATVHVRRIGHADPAG